MQKHSIPRATEEKMTYRKMTELTIWCRDVPSQLRILSRVGPGRDGLSWVSKSVEFRRIGSQPWFVFFCPAKIFGEGFESCPLTKNNNNNKDIVTLRP
jgi:hypothetical protein